MAKTLNEIGSTEISSLLIKRMSVFTPDDVVSKVLGELERTGRYEAIVTSGTKIGLITIRDILNVEQPEHTKVEKIWKPLTPVTSDSQIGSVSYEMIRNNVRALPVVQDMIPIGIISQVDIIEALADCQELGNVPSKDLIKKPPITLEYNSKISLARKTMLEKGFSHIPVLRNGKLVGVVTAQDIVHTFVKTIGRRKVGELLGDKIDKFPGEVLGIMDKNPLIEGVKSSILDIIKGMRDHKKSVSLIVNDEGVVHGVITPRELLQFISTPVSREELPIYILGLTEEDFFERSVSEEKVRRTVEKSMRYHPDINEVSIRIKKQSNQGERARYLMNARILSPTEHFNVSEEGWDLLETFDELVASIDKVLKKAKRKPMKVPRRGRGRS